MSKWGLSNHGYTLSVVQARDSPTPRVGRNDRLQNAVTPSEANRSNRDSWARQARSPRRMYSGKHESRRPKGTSYPSADGTACMYAAPFVQRVTVFAVPSFQISAAFRLRRSFLRLPCRLLRICRPQRTPCPLPRGKSTPGRR